MIVRKVLRRLVNVFAYVEAQDRISKGKNEEALRLIERVFASYGEQAPRTHTPIFANVLYASLCARKGAKHASYDACVVAIEQLRKISATGKKRHQPDANYLLYACKYFVAESTPYVDSEAFKLAASIPITYADLDLPRTSRMIASVLNATPEWCAEFDGWFLQNLSVSQAANLP
ncbi:hypothetical protein [Phenylobacterium sp.]|uniref:hypothetical protein n=1 Tax=Phenylobacterium sp. TaxID=1871053 RepID=UPI0027324557|nr:hypothetical protein [Phenylobacterium sp.]MDP3633021.1 hypothetical protein [Phenylobacterium sp.]